MFVAGRHARPEQVATAVRTGCDAPVHPGSPFRRLQPILGTLAVAGLAGAWWLYPEQNDYSILRCTISYLGSPDADRNPPGWRVYQAGMTCLLLLSASFAGERHRRDARPGAWLAASASPPTFAALGLLVLAVWIPDSRSGRWFGMTTSQLHTRLAIAAIPVMGLGLFLDALACLRAGLGWLRLWPAHLFGIIVLSGAFLLRQWEEICRLDPTRRHWPGDGLHSTPLWEWIGFAYLTGYLVWLGRRRPPGPA